MENLRCLNCNEPVKGYYCSNCGQPASTERFSIKNVLMSERRSTHQRIQDFGFLYTLLELMRRPGHSIREYIEGKRINHFHYIRLILMLVVVEQILISLSPFHLSDLGTAENKEIYDFMEDFIARYSRIIILVCIPGYSLGSFLLFRRSGTHFVEHIVLNTYRASGGIMIYILFLIPILFLHQVNAYLWVKRIGDFAVLPYSIWFFYQYFSRSGYRKAGLFIRSVLATLFMLITVLIVELFIIGVIYY